MSAPEGEQVAASLERIIGRLAHDLRNPLAVVLSNLRYLTEQLSDPDLQEAAAESALSAEQLSGMIDAASAVIPLRKGHLQPVTGELRLHDLRQQVERLLAPTLGSKQLIWEFDDGSISTDVELLRRVVTAIVEHCIRRSPPGTSIAVRARRGDALLLQVSDEGPPFAPGHEPSFLRDAVPMDDNSDSRYRNDGGLGLYFAGVAARALGAKTSLRERDDGGGLVFELCIPMEPPSRRGLTASD